MIPGGKLSRNATNKKTQQQTSKQMECGHKRKLNKAQLMRRTAITGSNNAPFFLKLLLFNNRRLVYMQQVPGARNDRS